MGISGPQMIKRACRRRQLKKLPLAPLPRLTLSRSDVLRASSSSSSGLGEVGCHRLSDGLLFASMLASLVSNLFDFGYWLSNPWLAILALFNLWMFIDALRRREWIWALFIFVGFTLSALFYYF